MGGFMEAGDMEGAFLVSAMVRIPARAPMIGGEGRACCGPSIAVADGGKRSLGCTLPLLSGREKPAAVHSADSTAYLLGQLTFVE